MLIRTALCLLIVFGWCTPVFSQDTTLEIDKKVVTLKEVVVRNNMNVQAFMKRVQDDTSFYKAFRNLRVLGYTSLNDVRMLDGKGRVNASLDSKTRQDVANGCRWTVILDEKTTGDFFDRNHHSNYYTAQMYAGLFFAADTVCGESNIVAGTSFDIRNKSGLDKHKEQLKMLFFNPGKKVPGIPFIGNKIALFDEDVAQYYDFTIDMAEFKGENCYVFKSIPRADLSSSEKGRIVINEMTTWFDIKDWQIVARNYDLSYRAGVYDFDVHIEVEMTRFRDLIVPKVLRYNGNWDVLFKKRERGVFTATLSDFHD
jgi:hypothetical protein